MRKRTTFRLVCVSKMTYVRRMSVADDGRLCSPLYVMYTVHVPAKTFPFKIHITFKSVVVISRKIWINEITRSSSLVEREIICLATCR